MLKNIYLSVYSVPLPQAGVWYTSKELYCQGSVVRQIPFEWALPLKTTHPGEIR